MTSRSAPVDLLLCVKHGAEVAGNLAAPTGDCHPKPQWFGKDGVLRECDARFGTTPKILEYIDQQVRKRKGGQP